MCFTADVVVEGVEVSTGVIMDGCLYEERSDEIWLKGGRDVIFDVEHVFVDTLCIFGGKIESFRRRIV